MVSTLFTIAVLILIIYILILFHVSPFSDFFSCLFCHATLSPVIYHASFFSSFFFSPLYVFHSLVSTAAPPFSFVFLCKRRRRRHPLFLVSISFIYPVFIEVLFSFSHLHVLFTLSRALPCLSSPQVAARSVPLPFVIINSWAGNSHLRPPLVSEE